MKLNELIATVFFLGKIPIAPGTMGSLVTSIFFYAFLQKTNIYLMLLLVMMTFVLALISISAYTKGLQTKDKSEIVIDEVVGQLISLIPIIWYKDNLNNTILFIGASFFLFRLFDILKPQPIKYFDRINKAWAVIFDDCIAGLFAAITLILFIEYLVK